MWLYLDLICTIYRPEKNPAKKVTKNWNWSFLKSHPLKFSNIITGQKFKMFWNKRHNFQPRNVQFTDQRKAWLVTDSTNWTFHK